LSITIIRETWFLKVNTHENPEYMMTKSVFVAKFELCSSLVGITIYPKWLF
jgi:hypothetical protein